MMDFSVQSSARMNWALQQIKKQDGHISSYPLANTPPSGSSSFFSPFYLANFQRDAVPLASSSSSSPPSASSSTSRISPTVLFIIVILAVIFFISGLLHLLIRFLVKKRQPSYSSPQSNSRHQRDISSSEALQRQLQQLFHLHDSGLDQAFIDALPIFLYKEIVGPKEPFDCAVCLCEFTEHDKLRLLPVCSHAFHLNCIDTWLLSNSTCPLCRGSLFIPGLTIENPVFDFSESRAEDVVSGDREDGLSLSGQKPGDLEGGSAVAEKKVFPVKLGKFKNLNDRNMGTASDAGIANSITNNFGREEGESSSSSSSLDARRCYSMGSYQYVVGDSVLKVALNNGGKDKDDRGSRRRGLGVNSAAASIEGLSGKRLCVGNKGESFSVSKIWQWSNKKGKFPISSPDTASLDGSLSWIGKGKDVDT